MDYKAPVEAYTGVVREVTIGKGNKSLKIGGENILPLHFFDQGSNPNPLKYALEVLDMKPEDWPEHAVDPFKDVISDPVSWAKKCQGFGVDAVSLFLMSTDPAVKNAPADKPAELGKKVAEAITVPLVVYWSGGSASTCAGPINPVPTTPTFKFNSVPIVITSTQEFSLPDISQYCRAWPCCYTRIIL